MSVIRYVIAALALISVMALPAAAQDAAPVTTSLEARVTAVLEERVITDEGGSMSVQQDLQLEITEGQRRGERLEYRGISDVEVLSAQAYAVGDPVVVQETSGPDGETVYAITDYVRRLPIYWLAALFAVVTAIVGGRKGLRALLALAASFLVIVKLVLPAITSGYSPLLAGLIGAMAVMTIIIYVTEGWSRKAHVAILSVSVTLLITLALSVFFTAVTRLTGTAQEETMFLVDALGTAVDFRGLLLAGILIGTIGVLDDIIIGQIEAVIQIREANPALTGVQTFVSAYKVGNAHFGAIINTLFLTYAGAALPLLILFSIRQEPFLGLNDVLNNELVATEIVRALVGSLGLAVAMPISTFLACRFLAAKTANSPAKRG